MKNKLWKELIVAVFLISTILSFSPVAYGQTTSIQQSMDAVKMEMKQAALAYVDPALKGELASSASLYAVLNSVKKNYEETKKLILASNLSETEKQAKLKELEALYEEKITKGLIPYIDAYNYATKYLEPLLKEIKEAEAKNDFLAVEKAYHKLSVQLKSRTSILYRFTGKAARDLLLEKYKKPADTKRDELIVPVTIIMKAATAQQLLLADKKEEAQKLIEEIQALAATLSSTHPIHLALLKELERLQAIVFPVPPVTPPATGGGGSSETSAQRALRLAKAEAIKVLSNYKVDVTTDYSVANWAEIEKRKATGVIAIDAAKTKTEVEDALNDAKTEINKVPIKSNDSTVGGITVKGKVAKVNTTDPSSPTYKVILPAGTDLKTLTEVDIVVIPTDRNAGVAKATSTDNGATWQVTVTSEDGKKNTTYTINVAVNNAPTVATSVGNQDGKVGKAVIINLKDVFTDADGDNLLITADKGEITGSTWSYTPVKGDAGTTIIVTLTAKDGKDGTVQETFEVTMINQAPVIINSFNYVLSPLSDALNSSGMVNFSPIVNVFRDPDGDILSYTVKSSHETVATIALRSNGVDLLRVSKPSSPVEVTFTITANDNKGGTVSDVFRITINN